MTDPEDLNSQWRELSLVVGGFGYFKALSAACRIAVFDFLSERPEQTVAELSSSTGVPDRSMRLLLQTLLSLRLVERSSSKRFRNTEVAQSALVCDSPQNILAVIEGFDRILYPGMSRLESSLREGRNLGIATLPGDGATIYERLRADPELEGVFHRWVDRVSELSSSAFDVVPEFGEARHILDVGGGGGANAVALCRRFPDLRVTTFDYDSVCRIAENRAREEGLSDRISTISGDFITDSLPQGYDAILYAHIFNIFSPEKNVTMLKKAYDCLPWGGTVFLVNSVDPDERPASLGSALISLYFLAIATGEGMVYPVTEYGAWLAKAGFTDGRMTSVPGTDHAVIQAKKTVSVDVEVSGPSNHE